MSFLANKGHYPHLPRSSNTGVGNVIQEAVQVFQSANNKTEVLSSSPRDPLLLVDCQVIPKTRAGPPWVRFPATDLICVQPLPHGGFMHFDIFCGELPEGPLEDILGFLETCLSTLLLY